ncbi:MAG: hypothetical protein ACK559_34550, partial [bacterium]
MVEEHRRGNLPRSEEPRLHLRRVRMAAEPVQARDPRAHVELLAVDAHATRTTLGQGLGKRARKHVAGEHHGPVVVPDLVLEVVQH